MQAYQFQNFGEPETIAPVRLDLNEPKDNEVTVQVCATSVNPADWIMGSGALQTMIAVPLPFTPGMDFSGTITALGAHVTDLSVGDKVYGATLITQCGTYAEYVNVPAGLVAQAPQNIPLGTAAAVPLAALTAWGSLIAPEYANIQPDETILIHGAAGGVGCFAVQLAKWRKAKVIATASSNNAEFLKGIGADEVIDYKTQRFEDVVKNVDVVADLVGGDLIERSYQVIKPQGRLVSVVALPDQKIAEMHQVRPIYMPGFRSKNALDNISGLIDTGIIKVVISEELPLADAAKGLAKSRSGHVRGKIVLYGYR